MATMGLQSGVMLLTKNKKKGQDSSIRGIFGAWSIHGGVHHNDVIDCMTMSSNGTNLKLEQSFYILWSDIIHFLLLALFFVNLYLSASLFIIIELWWMQYVGIFQLFLPLLLLFIYAFFNCRVWSKRIRRTGRGRVRTRWEWWPKWITDDRISGGRNAIFRGFTFYTFFQELQV